MPITITPKEFKAGTQHPLTSRFSSHLTLVDIYLEDYYVDLEEDPEGERMGDTLELLLESIRVWTQGKKTWLVHGETRYRDWRDRKGLISRLEREAEQTLRDLNAYLGAVENNLRRNLGRRLTPRAFSRPLAPPPLPARPAARPVRIGPPLNPPAQRPHVPGAAHVRERIDLPPTTPLGRGSIAAAARLLQLSGLQVSIQGRAKVPDAGDIADAISRATGLGRQTLQTSVTFDEIAEGLDNLGFSVEHVRRTDLTGLNAALARSSRTRPLLLCVGDRAPSHEWNGPDGRAQGPEAQTVHAIVSTGRSGKDGTFKVEDFHFRCGPCMLFEDGDYFASDLLGGKEELMTAEPSLGYIRVRPMGV